jgi:hypothetical protein
MAMSDATLFKLLASHDVALDVAQRNLTIARALAAGYRSGVRPPDVVLEAYLTRFDADEAQIADLRGQAKALKSELNVES